MQRRLNLAAALVHEPPLLLLDEPTAGVDPQSRSAILDVVQGLAERGHAVLYTTHYMDEAQRICSRVAIVDHGRVLETGTVESLRAAHGGDLEAAFLALTGRSLRD
jgi:ABC-2 type transport system ATP-binding protein